MAERRAKVLREGEFFILVENRGENQVLRGEFDANPAETKSRAIARLLKWQELYPNPPLLPHGYPLFDDAKVPYEAAWLPEVTNFKRSIPKKLSHTDRAIDPAIYLDLRKMDTRFAFPFGYKVVSKEWKLAIEYVEPGVHEFFPHQLRFADGVISDRFIFRDRRQLEFIDMDNSMIGGGVQIIGSVPGKPRYRIRDFKRKGLVAKRKLVAGHHWLKQVDFGETFVSRKLAERLFPLLPPSTWFEPVVLPTITIRLPPYS